MGEWRRCLDSVPILRILTNIETICYYVAIL